MTAELIISVSGLRGIVGHALTADVARRYAAAYAAELPAGPIVVTRDGRESGPWLAEAIFGALAAAGRAAWDGGVAATPTTGVLVRALGAAGGIQISASHNPAEYNGVKLFNAAGRVMPAAEGQRVADRFRQSRQHAAPPAPPASAPIADTVAEHLGLVEAIVDVPRIRAQRFRVVLDSAHGAGSVLGRVLLEHLGCDATLLGATPDGLFDHPPEPTEANLASVVAQVGSRRAHVAFCQDPDADRLAIIDERSRYLGEELTLGLCVDHVLRQGRVGPVVTNCSTSRIAEDLAARYGAPFFRSRVGEANVVDQMLAVGAVIGGEGNGGVIDPRVVLVRDSFVGMALVLDAMAAREAPVSSLAAELPRYAMCKSTVAVASDRLDAALAALPAAFPDATADRLDGLRLDWPSGDWLLVRPSNTEPIVRAIAESRTPAGARALCDQAVAALNGAT